MKVWVSGLGRTGRVPVAGDEFSKLVGKLRRLVRWGVGIEFRVWGAFGWG